MKGKLHCLLFICVLISVCRSQHGQQPYPLNFRAASRIRSFNNPSYNPYGNPGILLPRQPRSKRQTNCEIENALVDYGGSCHSLFTQGPCSENQWLILNEQEKPTCVQRPCQEGKFYYNGKCVSLFDTTVCEVSQILYVALSGNAYCNCLPHTVYEIKAEKCVAKNDEGSCPFDQHLDTDSSGKLRCTENPCKREDLLHNPENNKCYKKVYKGLCREDQGYQVNYDDKDEIATCATIQGRSIFVVPRVRSGIRMGKG